MQTDMKIEIIHNPDQSVIDQYGCQNWPIWEKEVSRFPWTYDAKEVCLVLEGEVTVTPQNGDAVIIRAGDLVTFPEGMSCEWNVTKPIRKHYNFY